MRLDEGSCNEEEEYNTISEGEEESEESVETPKSEHNYTMLLASLEVIYRTSSPTRIVDTRSTSSATSAQGIPPSLNCSLNNPDTDSMASTNIRLLALNGNGVEDTEQHWFLCEAIWMVL